MGWMTAVTLLVVVLSTVLFFKSKAGHHEDSSSSNIPWAPSGIPLLGHALKYKQNPGEFLVYCIQNVGNLFKINLAGKHMVVVCGPRKQRIVASSTESILSARQAVADMGFEQMLGRRNVHKGTDIHKPIIKSFVHSTEVVVGFINSIKKSLHLEINNNSKSNKFEFMNLIRRVLLRSIIEELISPVFVASDDWEFPFIEQFMVFQDDLEDATAKSAVLPRFLALTLFLWPIQRRRVKLQAIIAQRLDTILNNGSSRGFWLKSIHDQGHNVDEISEFIVGLLFAAHKNPAIGSAQSYLFLWERTTTDQQNDARKESEKLLANPPSSLQQVQYSCPTLHRLCLETLRLTAHSIGAIRTVRGDFQLGDDLTIPKGSTIALTHLASSLNPEYWKDPQHLDLGRSMESYENDYIFNVFSHGVHKCPGQKLAVVLLQCSVAILLNDFEITLPQTIPPLCFERATLAQRQDPVNVTITVKK